MRHHHTSLPSHKSKTGKTSKGQKDTQSGFTLIELAISMIIMGLLTAALFAAFKVENQKRQLRKQIDNFEESRKMLRAFAYEPQLGYYGSAGFNGDADGGLDLPGDPTPEQTDEATAERLPCPANPTLGVGDINFGRESLKAAVTIDGDDNDDDPETGTNNMTLAENADGRTCDITGLTRLVGPDGTADTADDILIGAFPFRTLGMTVFEGTDAYRQQYSYAVTAGTTLYGRAAETSGSIQINDVNGNDTGNRSQFMLISHGETGEGARSIYGAQVAPCDTGDIDGENCDGDEVFIAEGFSASRQGTQFYDDLATNTFQAITTTDTWWEVHDDGTMIYNTNDGMDRRVIMGNAGTTGDVATDALESQVSIENILNGGGTPSAHLSFFGDGADNSEHFGYITIDNPDDATNEQLGLFMALNNNTGDQGANGLWEGLNDEHAFMVLRSGNTGTAPGSTTDADERFIFWGDGQSFFSDNVGIRTRLPDTSLHVTSGGAEDGLTLENLVGTQSRIVHWDDTPDQLQFRVGSTLGPGDVDADGDADMVINADGDVGIGINAPTDKLEVNATGTAQEGITIRNDSNFPNLRFRENADLAEIRLRGTQLLLWNDDVNIRSPAGSPGPRNLSFEDDAGAIQAFIREDGTQLRLNSANDLMLFDGSAADVLFLNADGEVQADVFTYPSDARFKNVKGAAPGIDLLNQISVYQYKWKDSSPRNADDALHSGVLAQELRKIPELSYLVHGTEGNIEDGEHLRVDYVGLVPLLIQSAKEINAENSSLETRISSYEKRQKDQIQEIGVLESDIKALKDYVQPAPAKGATAAIFSPLQKILLTLFLLISGAGLGALARKHIKA